MTTLPTKTTHLDAFIDSATPREVRPIHTFAEQEILIPEDWRYGGQRYSYDIIPFQRTLWDIFESGEYNRFFLEAARQSSKTFPFLILMMYYLFESRESILVGLPNLDFAETFWVEKLYPLIRASRYSTMMPDTGPGSRGGPPRDYITFKNGATLYFAAEGFSKSIRVIFFTEIYRMKEGSRTAEAGTFYQLEQCATAYDMSARIFGECIPTDGTGKIHAEVTGGTDSRVYMQCPYCDEYVPPEREQFTGWQEAPDELTAAQEAGYLCNECNTKWDEHDREYALAHYRIVHNGQTVDKQGKTHGDPPRTMTFGLNWPRFQSGMATMKRIAMEEWRAEYGPADTMDTDPQQAIKNYVWGMIYESDIEALPEITKEIVTKKLGRTPRGAAPQQTETLTVFVDVGLYICWYNVWSWWGHMQGRCIDYGSIEVPDTGHKRTSITRALKQFDAEVLQHGFRGPDDSALMHDMCFVDMGFQRDAVYDFILDTDPHQRRYRASQGEGVNEVNSWSKSKASKPKKNRLIGDHYYVDRQPSGILLVHMDADWLKMQIHQGFMAPAGTDGALTMYEAEPREHTSYGKMIAAERQRTEFRGGKEVIKWIKTSRRNHYLDCAYGCYCAALLCGMSITDRAKSPARRRRQKKEKPKKRTASGSWLGSRKKGWLG
jgi:phage terminase large subunit GpA-like protein